MTPELAIQKAFRARLVGAIAITSLVPAASILDRNERPAPDPSIVIGEGNSVDDGGSLGRDRTRVYLDVHIWKTEPGTVGVKIITGAIRTAVKAGLPALDPGFHCADWLVASSRFLRDPDGLTSHAIVSLEALVEEIA